MLRRHRVNGLARYDWLSDTLEVTQLDFTDRWHIRSDRYVWTPDAHWRRVTRAARVTKPRGGGGTLAAIVLAAARNRPSLAGVDTVGALWGDVVPSPNGRWVVTFTLTSWVTVPSFGMSSTHSSSGSSMD